MKSSNLSFGVWNLDIIFAKITHEYMLASRHKAFFGGTAQILNLGALPGPNPHLKALPEPIPQPWLVPNSNLPALTSSHT